MSKTTYLALLKSHDDPASLEVPLRFDWQVEVTRLRRFAVDLQVALQAILTVETGELIQDATFHGQIILSPEVLEAPHSMDEVVVLRMSNFGRFAAVSREERVKPEILERIKQLLSENDYVFIPSSVLICPYVGVISWLSGEATWWNRYFDWV